MTECVNTPYAAQMQDRYTGDVGDFGKYGMLRRLCGLRDGAEPLKLGVVWYRPAPEAVESESAADGKHINYLSTGPEGLYQPCDPPLYAALREIVECNSRSVEAVERAAMLGSDAVFYGGYIPDPGKRARGEDRVRDRLRWVEDALETTGGCDVVFLDPDNGLEPQSISTTNAPKYVYLSEVEKWFGRGQSVVVYHHLGRNGTHAEQIARWLKRLGRRFGPAEIFALRFRRGTSRAFFVLATAEHAGVLRERAKALTAAPWGEHFDLHE